ncbi:MAG: M64 family metallopeptidase [Bacteroidales bacterium]
MIQNVYDAHISGGPHEKVDIMVLCEGYKKDEWEDNYLNNIEYTGEVGAYEGAMYHAKGFYRSEPNCIIVYQNRAFLCCLSESN